MTDANETILGLDVGGTKTAIVEGTSSGEILQRSEIATGATWPFDRVFPAMAALMDNTRRKAEEAGRRVRAISVAVGGPLRIADGVLLDPPHLPGWHGIPLKSRLEARFPGLPVFVEHDGNAGALAEYHFGAAHGLPDVRHLIFLTFGTGLGAGFIINGRVLRGASDTAGEVGHWRLAPDGPVGFGKAGSWEGLASGQGLVSLAALRYPDRWEPTSSIRELVADVLEGDPQALAVVREAGEWMGHGMALLIDALNPHMIVLGSLAVVLGERILAPAREVLAREALPQAVAACRIVPAALGKSIGDVACLMAALAPDLERQRSSHS